MTCPLGKEAVIASPDGHGLGLCGPSELKDMPRNKQVLAQDLTVHLPRQPPACPTVVALRLKFRYLTKARGSALLKPSTGRQDLADLIMSFLAEERPLVKTEVDGLMHADSGCANVDLFFQSLPQAMPEENKRLQ